MHFVIVAKDAKDEKALERRLNAREAHIKHINDNLQNVIIGAATFDDEREKMNGSVIMVDFPSKTDVEDWLQTDPYIKNNVWDDIEIISCKVAPSFENKLP